MRSKGQAFLSDFSVSIAVFGVIVAAFFVPWNSIVQADNRFAVSEEMKTEAERTAAFLVTTDGYPKDWEEPGINATIAGFATQDNLLSMKKIEEFRNMTYEEQRSLIGSQEFYMVFTRDGSTVQYGGEGLDFGKDPLNDSYSPGTTVVVNRNVVLDLPTGVKSAKMKLVSWRR